MKQLTKALLFLICAAMCIPALGEEAPLTRQWYLEQTLAMARDVQALAEDENYLSSYLSDSEALAACTDAAGMRVQEDSDFLLISVDEALLRTLFGDEAEVILPLSENLLRMLPRLLILSVTNQQDASSMARFSVLSAQRYWNLAVKAVPCLAVLQCGDFCVCVCFSPAGNGVVYGSAGVLPADAWAAFSAMASAGEFNAETTVPETIVSLSEETLADAALSLGASFRDLVEDPNYLLSGTVPDMPIVLDMAAQAKDWEKPVRMARTNLSWDLYRQKFMDNPNVEETAQKKFRAQVASNAGTIISSSIGVYFSIVSSVYSCMECWPCPEDFQPCLVAVDYGNDLCLLASFDRAADDVVCGMTSVISAEVMDQLLAAEGPFSGLEVYEISVK